MEITIGRDVETSRLRLTADGKESLHGQAGSVPPSVGQEHCKFVFTGNTIRLKNLDVNNYTFVNGQSIESKVITKNDKIELGTARYLLDWNIVAAYGPADITPLKTIWDEYEKQNLELTIAAGKFNSLRSATGVITMVAIALSIATGGRSRWYLLLYGIAIIISVAFFIKAYKDASKLPQKRQELNRKFQRDYVCPNCGHSMGNQSFDILVQNGSCPYCKKAFHT